MFLIVQRPGHNIWIRCTYYYAPKYKCLSNHINSTLNCVQGSLDLRSLRSSDKLTARYFSVGKKSIPFCFQLKTFACWGEKREWIRTFFHEKELKLDLMEKLSDHHPGGMDYITFQINFSTIKENIWNHEIPSIESCTLRQKILVFVN